MSSNTYLVLFAALVMLMPWSAAAQQRLPNGVYTRADPIRLGERGDVCLCTGEFTASPEARDDDHRGASTHNVFKILTAPPAQASEVGRYFYRGFRPHHGADDVIPDEGQ